MVQAESMWDRWDVTSILGGGGATQALEELRKIITNLTGKSLPSDIELIRLLALDSSPFMQVKELTRALGALSIQGTFISKVLPMVVPDAEHDVQKKLPRQTRKILKELHLSMSEIVFELERISREAQLRLTEEVIRDVTGLGENALTALQKSRQRLQDQNASN